MLILALLLEVIEGVFGVGIAIEVEIHLRVVGLELGTGLRHEAIETHAVAVAFGVRQVSQHFGDGEAVRRGLPPSVLFGQLGHEAAKNFGSDLQQVDAGQSIIRHHLILRRSRRQSEIRTDPSRGCTA